ncbi:hypothetical protein Q0590_31480 [Rhodocytophaga aerolata]|uniref:Uncharacterized protein n=1 Tax=Rhodocytophaga aerolata TaxID=455078 RepID=A0ABT8RI45_9BACT|nr:hypothetical protein [Rhodocytophaga aerolata]MDO1450838.1 hypothetical protein [Rhodocytophaga aerolata]
MADYTENSILSTPGSTYKGLAAVRGNFIAFKAFSIQQNPLNLNNTVVERDIAYILWQANTLTFKLVFATDTFYHLGWNNHQLNLRRILIKQIEIQLN